MTLLPKSVTTAIGMDLSRELGGVVAITTAVIIVTGILGNVIGDFIFSTFRIKHPIAKGLALGNSAHAIGTAKAMELGEVEGAMSSLAIRWRGCSPWCPPRCLHNFCNQTHEIPAVSGLAGIFLLSGSGISCKIDGTREKTRR